MFLTLQVLQNFWGAFKAQCDGLSGVSLADVFDLLDQVRVWAACGP
jgi:hypothetical protein